LVNVVILHHFHAQTGAVEDVGSGVQHTTLGIEDRQRQAGPAWRFSTGEQLAWMRKRFRLLLY
jgi:hypothetical protein